ncbi:MAG: OmpA family protein, partial [Candidatus Omnitrophica bacterium]|nr:OmpA family protein [Candidatus Omnitrophota bacterium]
MIKSFKAFFLPILLLILVMSASSCTVIFQKGRRVDVEKISKLKSELTDLERAKAELENRLRREIDDSEVKVEMLERGLVITFVAEVLFDSGKAELRQPSLETIKKVARVLNTTVKDLDVGVEGHTDNVPIKYSGWKSNWELSTARALSVLEFLVDKHDVDPKRVGAT